MLAGPAENVFQLELLEGFEDKYRFAKMVFKPFWNSVGKGFRLWVIGLGLVTAVVRASHQNNPGLIPSTAVTTFSE